MSRYGRVKQGLKGSVKIFFFFLAKTVKVGELKILEGNEAIMFLAGQITIVNTKYIRCF